MKKKRCNFNTADFALFVDGNLLFNKQLSCMFGMQALLAEFLVHFLFTSKRQTSQRGKVV